MFHVCVGVCVTLPESGLVVILITYCMSIVYDSRLLYDFGGALVSVCSVFIILSVRMDHVIGCFATFLDALIALVEQKSGYGYFVEHLPKLSQFLPRH